MYPIDGVHLILEISTPDISSVNPRYYELNYAVEVGVKTSNSGIRQLLYNHLSHMLL